MGVNSVGANSPWGETGINITKMYLTTLKNPPTISYFCCKNTTILNNLRQIFLQTVVGVEEEDLGTSMLSASVFLTN